MKLINKLKDIFSARAYFRLKAVGIALVSGVFMAILLANMALENFELDAFDHMLKARPERKGPSDIVFIDMAEDSIKQIGRWPWPRDWHTNLINILSEYKAKMIGFDILFTEKSDELNDALLSEAIQRSANVYLPFVFETSANGTLEIVNSLPVFTQFAKGSGYINISPDPDGVIRKAPIVIKYNDIYYPQLAFKMACDYLGVGKEDVIINPGRYIELRNTKEGGIKIPLDEHNQILINWVGKWKESFKHYSYIDVIVSYQQIKDGLKPRIDLSQLNGKICLVGLTAIGLTDIKPTPLEPLYPAVGVHANIFDNIIDKTFLARVNKTVNIAILLLICLLMGLVVPGLKPVKGAVFSLLILVTYATCVFTVLIFKGAWINLIYTLIAITLSYIAVTLFSQIIIAIEKARLFQLATRDGLTGLFVIRHFNLLMDTQIKEARDLNNSLSVIMSDIDHFKKFNDTYGHQVGDFVLREVAKVFKSGCRQFDVAARYGGEEFIMMLPNTPSEGANNLAERLRKAVESADFRDKDNQAYKVTISLGVATFSNEFNKEELIKKADAALYKAKEAGRNQVCTA